MSSSCIIAGASHNEDDDFDVVVLIDGGGVVDGEVEGFARVIVVVGRPEVRHCCRSCQNSSP